MRIPLLGQTGEEAFDDVLYQKTQNWYPHINPDSKSKLMLYPTPGSSVFTTAGSGVVRGMIEFGGELYTVINNELYKVTSTGAKILLGTINTSYGRVSMAHNGFNNGQELLIVDGTDGWIYDISVSPATLTRLSVWDNFHSAGVDLEPTFCDFIDSFFIINDPANSGRFYISGSYDGTTWDSLQFSTAERNPDELSCIKVSDRTLFLIGTHTTEMWYNSGQGNMPFTPRQNGFMQWGTVAPHSVVEASGNVLWLAQNDEGVGKVVMSSGGTPKVVSTMGIAAEIEKLTKLDDAYGFAYQHQHHTFYVLTFPTDKRTFVYDLSTNMWHEWASKSTGHFLGTHHVYVFGKHLVGGAGSNKIYELDWNLYTEDGDAITRIRRSMNVHNADAPNVPLVHNSIHIDIKEGVGSAAITDPQLKLRWRDENGPWSSYHSRSMGKIGEYNKELIWRRLGHANERVYEISTQDPVPAVIIDAYGILSTGAQRAVG